MASVTCLTRRLLLAAGLAVAASAAPLITGYGTLTGPGTPLASCPAGEVLDTASGACKPATDQPAPVNSAINPEKAQLQPGEITSSRDGDVGSLPEVNGIPCTGAHGGGGSTGECIGLEQNQNNYQQPHSSVNGQTVTPGA